MTEKTGASIAVWALTGPGADLAGRIAAGLGGTCFVPRASATGDAQGFDRLGPAVVEFFHRFDGHVFVMATGIVVRLIAPLLRHKTVDPAVVVVDEAGCWAVSLLSGHIGGANRLAERVAARCGAQAVITTATDVRQVPAIDVIATERGLAIENPVAIKAVSMALLAGQSIGCHDPGGWLDGTLAPRVCRPMRILADSGRITPDEGPGVFVDDRCLDLPGQILVLRPPSLVAGIGCNRGTGADEIRGLLTEVLLGHRLSPRSVAAVATIDIKSDEPGLKATAAALGVPLRCYSAARLSRVCGLANASAVVHRHVGVGNVCEAAAILGAGQGALIIPKHKTANVTVAIARRVSTSSASALEARTTSPHGPEPY